MGSNKTTPAATSHRYNLKPGYHNKKYLARKGLRRTKTGRIVPVAKTPTQKGPKATKTKLRVKTKTVTKRT